MTEKRVVTGKTREDQDTERVCVAERWGKGEDMRGSAWVGVALQKAWLKLKGTCK